uniref:Uncharacterized protein LOC101512800 n=1 Tax=Cicer arietinum TaxID=3827 RepID=A0A1S2XQ95_CICAR|nr:uncharacterized protein LOC101512800 [Cicer arietinum]
MLGESSTIAAMENQSALAARGVPHHFGDNRLKKKKKPWCDHCQRTGHTKDTCWKIHGKPADWKPSKSTMDRESRGNHVSTKEPWIVDPGASEHMTGDKSLFHHCNPCYDGLSVKIVDGSFSKVAGIGFVTLSKDIKLKSILHVPNLD